MRSGGSLGAGAQRFETATDIHGAHQSISDDAKEVYSQVPFDHHETARQH